MEAAFKYYVGDRLYLWKKEKPQASAPVAIVAPADRAKLGLSSGKLRDLAHALDIQDQGPAQ